jgi:hypothetical protein
MAVLPSLATPDVWIAFNPTASGTTLTTAAQQALPASGASNAYWTNVTQYVRDFDTSEGRQHFIDRVEAGTLTLTLNGRDGYFFNGTTNGTGYVIQPRCPIAVAGTTGGTTSHLFWGLIDSVDEKVTDQVNVDLQVQASDQTKQLALRYLQNPGLWSGLADSTSAANWYRCTTTSSAVITSVSATATVATFYAVNTFNVGDNVTVTCGVSALNQVNKGVASVITSGSTQIGFTISGTFTAQAQIATSGSVYRTAVLDQIGSNNGNFMGVVSFPTYGAVIYDNDGCVDAANGGSVGTGYVRLPIFAGTQGALDFWVLGQGIANTTLAANIYGGGTVSLLLQCDVNGNFVVNASSTIVSSGIKINDGFWHHVGLVSDSAGHLQLYCDGTFTALTAIGTMTGWNSNGVNTQVGVLGNLNPSPAYYDEIIVSTSLHLAGLEGELSNRWVGGHLLQGPTSPLQASVRSGDRIAEVLVIAGYGQISAGAVSIPTGSYLIGNVYGTFTTYTPGSSTNGFANTEPYYWGSPVINYTALDLIYQICDTDIGSFYQRGDGVFIFTDQNYYGTWTYAENPTTFSWTPFYTTPSGINVWSDDASSNYAYEPTTLKVTRDDADVWTSVRITPQAGVAQVYQNTTAQARWGYSTLLKASTVHDSLKAARSTATFLGYLFSSPLPRVDNVELSSTMNNGANLAPMLQIGYGDVVQIKRTSPNASTSGAYPSVMGQINEPMVIERKHVMFQADPGVWTTSFVLDPYPVRT